MGQGKKEKRPIDYCDYCSLLIGGSFSTLSELKKAVSMNHTDQHLVSLSWQQYLLCYMHGHIMAFSTILLKCCCNISFELSKSLVQFFDAMLVQFFFNAMLVQ